MYFAPIFCQTELNYQTTRSYKQLPTTIRHTLFRKYLLWQTISIHQHPSALPASIKFHHHLQGSTRNYGEPPGPTSTYKHIPSTTNTPEKLPPLTNIFQHLPGTTRTFQHPAPTTTYRHLPAPTSTYQSLPVTTSNQDLQALTSTKQHLPTDWQESWSEVYEIIGLV